MKLAGERMARCENCGRLIKAKNLMHGRDGTKVGRCCLRKQLAATRTSEETST